MSTKLYFELSYVLTSIMLVRFLPPAAFSVLVMCLQSTRKRANYALGRHLEDKSQAL